MEDIRYGCPCLFLMVVVGYFTPQKKRLPQQPSPFRLSPESSEEKQNDDRDDQPDK